MTLSENASAYFSVRQQVTISRMAMEKHVHIRLSVICIDFTFYSVRSCTMAFKELSLSLFHSYRKYPDPTNDKRTIFEFRFTQRFYSDNQWGKIALSLIRTLENGIHYYHSYQFHFMFARTPLTHSAHLVCVVY